MHKYRVTATIPETLLRALAAQPSIPVRRGQWARELNVTTTEGEVITLSVNTGQWVIDCELCGESYFTSYMVLDKVWADSGFDEKAIICAKCLQLHLDYPLLPEHFTTSRINSVIHLLNENSLRLPAAVEQPTGD